MFLRRICLGLNIVNGFISNSGLKDKALRLSMNFPEMKPIQIPRFRFKQISFSRKTLPYQRAIQLAKMIILNYSPDIAYGQENLLALLFDMNKLWEEYIYRMLIRDILEGYEVIYQDGQRFWESRMIRPDIVIRYPNETGKTETFVIDTKWRIPVNNQPTDDELKQMYAYNMFWEAPKSILLYPEVTPQLEYFGNFHKGRDTENKCKIGFVSVFNDDLFLNKYWKVNLG